MNSLNGTQLASNPSLVNNKQSLQNLLYSNVAIVIFEKKDGTRRTMRCTLRDDIAIPHEKKTDRVKEPKEDLLPVWDMDLSQWRTITVPNVISVEVS